MTTRGFDVVGEAEERGVTVVLPPTGVDSEEPGLVGNDPEDVGELTAGEVLLLYRGVKVDVKEALDVELDVAFETQPGISATAIFVPPVVPSCVSITFSQPYVILYDWETIVSDCVKLNLDV